MLIVFCSRNRDASDSVVDSLLAAEISMIALDTLELIVQVIRVVVVAVVVVVVAVAVAVAVVVKCSTSCVLLLLLL